MNVLSAMAGITDGSFYKDLVEDYISIVTIGGYNIDNASFKAAVENVANGREEFIKCSNKINVLLENEADIIRNSNPSWKGLISANIRTTTPESFDNLINLKKIDIIELNCHCRQKPMIQAGCGQALLENPNKLSEILEKMTHLKQDLSVKIRTNVDDVDIVSVIELLNSYPVKYIHVDATNPGIMEADYETLKKISKKTDKKVIGNNSVTTHDDYIKMLDCGVSGVSIARGVLDGKIESIFKK